MIEKIREMLYSDNEDMVELGLTLCCLPSIKEKWGELFPVFSSDYRMIETGGVILVTETKTGRWRIIS